MEFSYSQVRTFLTCAYEWDIYYKRRLTRKISTPSMELGSAVHVGMAARFRGQNYVKAIDAWAENICPGWAGELESDSAFTGVADLLRDITQKAKIICFRTIAEFEKDFEIVVDSNHGLLVEKEFRVKLDKRDTFICVIDLIVREKSTGYLWLVDFKVREKITTPPAEDFDMQMALYQAALSQHSIEAVGSIIYQVRSEVPQEPSLNVNGTMSRSGSIITDWETYCKALYRHGLDPSDYLDMQVKLADRVFQKQIRTYRSTETLHAYWSNFLDTIRRIKSARRSRNISRNIGQIHCPRCPVKDLCMAEFYNQSTDIILLGYQPKQ